MSDYLFCISRPENEGIVEVMTARDDPRVGSGRGGHADDPAREGSGPPETRLAASAAPRGIKVTLSRSLLFG